MISANLGRGGPWAIVVSALAAAGCPAQVERPAPVVQETETPASDARAVFKQAQAVASKGEWGAAAKLFHRAAALDPGLVAASLNEAISMERAGDDEGAQRGYRALHTAHPQDAVVALHLARTLLQAGQVDEAQVVARAVLRSHPEDVPLLNLLASVLRRQRKFVEAAKLCRRVLLRDQKNGAAMQTLARIYAEQGKSHLAETFFRHAQKLKPRDPSILVSLGLIAHARGELQGALLQFEAAVNIDPKHAVALANIGAIALGFRDYERAETVYRRALAAGLPGCAGQSALGYALQGKQKAKAAVSQLEKAYALCPKDHELLMSMGLICLEQLRDNSCALRKFQAYSAARKGLQKDHKVFRFIVGIEEQIAREKAAAAAEVPEETGPEGSTGGSIDGAQGGGGKRGADGEASKGGAARAAMGFVGGGRSSACGAVVGGEDMSPMTTTALSGAVDGRPA